MYVAVMVLVPGLKVLDHEATPPALRFLVAFETPFWKNVTVPEIGRAHV